jgi:anti-sigma factor RsiW
MSMPQRMVEEDELHAYVDGQLGEARLSAVRQYLAVHPAEATRVARYAAQRQMLRAAFAAQQPETLPPSLDLTRLVQERIRRRDLPWRAAAAVLLAAGLGAAGGWLLHRPASPPRLARAMSVLEQQALAAHAVYAVETRHPVEVTADQRDHLVRWLSNRLNRKVNPPDLSTQSYQLIGGRLLATERGGAAALFMYQTVNGDRLSLLMRPMSADLHAPEVDLSRGSVSACAWIAHGMGYALVAAAPEKVLDKLSDQVRQELGAG